MLLAASLNKLPYLSLGWNSASLKLLQLTNDALELSLDRGQVGCNLLSAHLDGLKI